MRMGSTRIEDFIASPAGLVAGLGVFGVMAITLNHHIFSPAVEVERLSKYLAQEYGDTNNDGHITGGEDEASTVKVFDQCAFKFTGSKYFPSAQNEQGETYKPNLREVAKCFKSYTHR